MDPEDLREVIAAYRKCTAETVRHLGGFVSQHLGPTESLFFSVILKPMKTMLNERCGQGSSWSRQWRVSGRGLRCKRGFLELPPDWSWSGKYRCGWSRYHRRDAEPRGAFASCAEPNQVIIAEKTRDAFSAICLSSRTLQRT